MPRHKSRKRARRSRRKRGGDSCESKTLEQLMIEQGIFEKANEFAQPYGKTVTDLQSFIDVGKYFGQGGFDSVMDKFALKAKKSIPTHVDGGESLNIARRIHVPIVTTHKVSFTVGDETKLMREGEMWEINNSRKKHSVQNTSSYDRIHLIFDYVPHSLLHQLNISTQ